MTNQLTISHSMGTQGLTSAEKSLLALDYPTLMVYLHKKPQENGRLMSMAFWQEKAFRDFGFPKEEFFNLEGSISIELTPASRYLQILTTKGGVETESEKWLPLEDCLLRATQQGHVDKMAYFVRAGAQNLNICLYEGVSKNNLDVVKFLCQHGADDITGAITIATEKNHETILNYLLGRRDLNQSEESLKSFESEDSPVDDIDDNDDTINNDTDMTNKSDNTTFSHSVVNQQITV